MLGGRTAAVLLSVVSGTCLIQLAEFFNQRDDISKLKGSPLKLVDKFTYFGSTVSSTENDINTRLAKAWTATDRLMSDLTDKIKSIFFQAAVVSILLYGCTTWALTKRMEIKLYIYIYIYIYIYMYNSHILTIRRYLFCAINI